MRNISSAYLKQMLSALSALVKSKSMALKSKTSAMRTRIMIYSLLSNKKVFMGSISHKFQSLIGHLEKHGRRNEDKDVVDDQSKAIVLYNSMANESHPYPSQYETLIEADGQYYGYYDEEKYPDLTHSLFELQDSEDGAEESCTSHHDKDHNGSVIDLVRNSREGHGEDFRLEDEIDHVADLFIRKFRRQMRLEKQESFKNYQEMLARGV